MKPPERHAVFGWTIHRQEVAAGEGYTSYVPETVDTTRSGNFALWVRGRIEGLKPDGSATLPRVPGFCTHDQQAFMAGFYRFTAIEDSEWWCMNWVINRKSLPLVSVVKWDSPDAVHSLPAGTRLFLASGTVLAGDKTLTGPVAITLNNPATLTFGTAAYGLLFE